MYTPHQTALKRNLWILKKPMDSEVSWGYLCQFMLVYFGIMILYSQRPDISDGGKIPQRYPIFVHVPPPEIRLNKRVMTWSPPLSKAPLKTFGHVISRCNDNVCQCTLSSSVLHSDMVELIQANIYFGKMDTMYSVWQILITFAQGYSKAFASNTAFQNLQTTKIIL